MPRKAEDGAAIAVSGAGGDVLSLVLSSKQLSRTDARALAKLIQSGSRKNVSAAQMRRLSKAEIRIGDASEGPICRFDLKCISIKRESAIDLLALGAQRHR